MQVIALTFYNNKLYKKTNEMLWLILKIKANSGYLSDYSYKDGVLQG